MTATATLLTAAEWAARLRAPVRDHSYRLTGPGSAVVDYLAFKQMSGAAARTLDQYERDLARLCILLADRTLETIESEDLLHVVSTYPRPSQRRAAAAYRDFFKWAYAWGKRPDNPMDRLPRIKREPVPLLEVFNQADIDRLLAHHELRDRVLLRILLETGIRKGEAIALTLADVDLDQRRLKVRRGKGGKARVIPIGHRLAHEIAELAVLDGINPGWHLWYTVKANAISSRLAGSRSTSSACLSETLALRLAAIVSASLAASSISANCWPRSSGSFLLSLAYSPNCSTTLRIIAETSVPDAVSGSSTST